LYAEVEYEFGQQSGDESAAGIARSIRDNDLYELNLEMEKIFEKTLETREIERITSLYVKKGLSVEYILTLSAFLKDKKQNLTVESIVREANKLVAKEIDTLESLEVYVKEKNEEISGEMEMRRLFGIYGRTLTKSERDYFKRWMHEYGYSSTIIGEAYDISVSATGKMSLPYINSILAAWYEAGCKTLDECRVKVNTRKHENSKKANNNSQKSRKSTESDVPKYADFNSEDALLRAIERSYGADTER
jgi:DnaD/phage-associated family protein